MYFLHFVAVSDRKVNLGPATSCWLEVEVSSCLSKMQTGSAISCSFLSEVPG